VGCVDSFHVIVDWLLFANTIEEVTLHLTWTFCPYSGGRRGEEYSTGCQFSLDEWYVKIIAGSTKFVLRGKKVGGASYIAAIRHTLLILPCKYSLYRIVEYDIDP
jgi:hypothetical protein